MNVYTLHSDLPIFPIASKSLVGNYEIQVQANDVSDGHHTMEELYEHRHALFIALLKTLDSYVTPLAHPHVRCWKSKLHDDGSMYEGWFIAGYSQQSIPFNMEEPISEQHVAYHMPIKYWDKLTVISLEKAPPYNGYTPEDVRKRLLKL